METESHKKEESRVSELRSIIESVDLEELLKDSPENALRQQGLVRAWALIKSFDSEDASKFSALQVAYSEKWHRNKDYAELQRLMEDMLYFASRVAEEMDTYVPDSFPARWRQFKDEWKFFLGIVLVIFAAAFYFASQYAYAFLTLLLLVIIVRLEFLRRLIFSGGSSRLEALLGDNDE